MANEDTWSKVEKDLLRKHYPEGGAMKTLIALSRLGTKRTTVDIENKAKQLGLKKNIPRGKFALDRSTDRSKEGNERDKAKWQRAMQKSSKK